MREEQIWQLGIDASDLLKESVNHLKEGNLENHYKLLAIAEHYYKILEVPEALRLCNRLFEKGINRGDLIEEDIEELRKYGGEKGNFIISLYLGGRRFLEGLADNMNYELH